MSGVIRSYRKELRRLVVVVSGVKWSILVGRGIFGNAGVRLDKVSDLCWNRSDCWR